MKKNAYALLVAGFAAAGLSQVQAQMFYPSINTNTYPAGTNYSYSSIVADNAYNNGITATYTLSTGNFGLRVVDGAFANVNGPILFNQQAGAAFHASFSQDLHEFIINFAADGNTGGTTMNVSGFENGTLVGSQTYGSAVPSGYLFDEGQIDFVSGAAFNSIVVSLGQAPNIALLWAIGADANGTGNLGGTPTPEPSTLALAGLGIAGFIASRRRK